MTKAARALVALLIVSPIGAPVKSAAGDAKGNYQIFGAGAESCGTWTAEKANNERGRLEDLVWALGWVSAYNRYYDPSGNIAAGTDSDGIGAWIDNYCAAHPFDSLGTAAEALILALRARKR